MNILTQQQKILALLRDAGDKGINSYGYARKIALQLPRVMNDLKKAHYKWVSIDNANRSVNYVLLSEPKEDKITKPQPQEKLKIVYDPVKQMGVWKTQTEIDEMNKPRQGVLI